MGVNPGGLIGLTEAAKACGVSLHTIHRWVEEDGVPLRRLPHGHGLHWKELHKCLVRRGLPFPEGLATGPRVLLVDDDPDLLLMMVDAMEWMFEKASIGTAQDGQRALEKLLSLRPDLLITDIEMPRLSGLELCRRVRQERELDHTKILAITGHHGPRFSMAALDSGADEYLVKPFAPDELRKAAVRLLGASTFTAAGWAAAKRTAAPGVLPG
jgi:CheY-like chemotaxis protein